jgi:hypothetical protein
MPARTEDTMRASPSNYDVYISFNQKDADAVRMIVNRLREAGVKVWMFDWYERGEEPWPSKMREALERSVSAAVIVGPSGLDPQQSEEVMGNIWRRQQEYGDSFRVIPVLLPGADTDILPAFLHKSHGVDFTAGLDDERSFGWLFELIRDAGERPGGVIEETGAAGESESPSEGDDDAKDAVDAHSTLLKTFEEHDGDSAQEVKQESAPPAVSLTPSSVPTPPGSDVPEKEEIEQESIQQASVSDQPSARDTLGFGPYVKAIATFLTNEKTQPPLTLSVEGEWGSGKSSFMLQLAEELCEMARLQRRWNVPRRLIRELPLHRQLTGSPLPNAGWLERFLLRRRIRVDQRRVKCLTVEFNPWRHDKENALWASFALEFVRKLSQGMSLPGRTRAHLRLLLRRLRWTGGGLVFVRMLLLGLIIVFLSVTFFQLLREDGLPLLQAAAGGDKEGTGLFRIIQASGVAGYGAVLLFFLAKLREFVGNPFAFDLRKYVESPDYEGNIAFIEQFHEDFRKIVDTYAGGNKVYIDDLDRCDVPKAADLMQAINLMISGGASQLVFIIGMDREKVAAGLAVKNEKLLPYLAQSTAQSSPDIAFGLEYGYNFIEKFIQIPFRVPQPAQMGVRTLLDFIAPLVEVAGEAGTQARDGGDAVAKLIEEGVLVVEESDADVDGTPRKTEAATQDAAPARRTQQAAQEAAEILREAGASIEVIGADIEEPAAKQPEEREGLMLLERGDSLTVRNIVLMVAPALDYNPRRIKQFINLFRLKAYIAYETGLFRRPRAGSPFDALTFQQLGKFVAISLRWPRLLADLDEDYGLLQRLQKIANGEHPPAGDQAVDHWRQRDELMNLLKFGCGGVEDLFDQDRLSDMGRYSLGALDVSKLLQVSPRVNRATPARVTPPSAPQTSPPTSPATGPPPESGAGLDFSEVAEQDADTFRRNFESSVRSLKGFTSKGRSE